MTRPRIMRAALAAMVIIAASAAWRSHAATAPDAVTIADSAFGPAKLTVQRGTTVIWTNKDDEPHTVVSDDDPKLFKSPPLDTDDTFKVTFDKPGTYKYFCTVHPRMQGTVVVQ